MPIGNLDAPKKHSVGSRLVVVVVVVGGSFCCSHACFCDDRVSSFNIQLTTPTRTPSSDLIGSSHPVCFLFAIQYVIISYGVLCFNRLRECPRGLQRPWLIFFFFFFFCCFIPLLYVLKENNRYITTTSPQRAFVRISFTMTSHCCVCTIL